MSKIILVFISNHILLKVEIEEAKEWYSSSMFIAALFTIAKTWKQLKCPPTEEWIKKMCYIYIQWNITQPL